MISKWCSLSRSPNTYVNTIKKNFRLVSSCVDFTFFLSRTPCSPNFKLQVNAPSNDPVSPGSCKDFSPPCPSLICQTWRNRSLHLAYNYTTLQVVEIVPADALHNHHWAFGHLENAISYGYHKTQCFQSTNWDKIPFKLRYIPHFLQFSYYPIKHLDTDCTHPFHITWYSSPMTAKRPSSFSKLEAVRTYMIGSSCI